ncbi:MAG: hypothetical protein SFU20_15125 [Chitinophagaceae bacterium]|nr:hypothetical protein [Chitinophagaceae bacterium]
MFNLFKKKAPVIPPEVQFNDWVKNGKPFPPPHIVKQNAIKEYGQAFSIKTLVETGTYLGEMVEAQLPNFESIYSIELSEKLYKRGLKKFKNQPKVHLLQGDSGKVMRQITSQLSAPALFWLDGHYSGGITALGDKECPVIEELNIITSDNIPHVILIDDARLFVGANDYPRVEDILSFCKNTGFNYKLENKDDILRLTPER